jgi:tRNA(Ile)-lysidine synthase
MFRRTRSVLAGVSGGSDSVALLLVLEQLAPQFGFGLTVCHFDHQLRPGSRADLEWVKALCESRGIAFVSGEGDVRDAAARDRRGIEETARRMRYQFLSFIAGQKGIDAIATGHTADDQAETVLMRVIRGTGIRGVRGMLPVATVPGGSQKLVRPLLDLSRAETRAICEAAGIEPLEDESNRDERVTRNRLRHAVLPLLEEMNPSVRSALRRLAANASELFERVEREAMACVPIARTPVGAIYRLPDLRGLPAEALGLVLEREAAFYRLPFETNATRFANARSALIAGTGAARFGGIEMEASAGLVRIGPALEAAAPVPSTILNVPGVTAAGPWRVRVSTEPPPGPAGPGAAAIPMEGQHGALRIRPLEPGDRVRYRGIERHVADLLVNARVPRWERLGAVAIADGRSVRAVLTASHAFETDHGPGASLLYVRLEPLATA